VTFALVDAQGDMEPEAARDEAQRELVARIRRGDEAAFRVLFSAHYNGLCVFAARILGSDAVAEEVVQESLIRIWEQRERWVVPGTVAAYLYATVRNRSLNRLRHERAVAHWRERIGREAAATAEVVRDPTPYNDVRDEELARALDRALDELPPRCRQAFVLRRQHHLSYVEIAHAMGIAPKTVEVQIGLALKALRKKMAGWL
jgi:RNA polymerase sigma-70 factor (ECF subfamily)